MAGATAGSRSIQFWEDAEDRLRAGTGSYPDPTAFARPGCSSPTQGLQTQLRFYNALSEGNSLKRRAVLQFNAHASEPGVTADKPAVHVGILTRDQISDNCPHYWEVQSITNQAAEVHSPRDFPTPQARGTAIHTWIRDEINGPPTVPASPPRDPNFRSEISVLKSEEARYGDPGSKRVDVYENPGTGTVCVCDIKTGESRLSFARMRELATNVGELYPGTTQIVVTEVKPAR